MLGTTLEEDIAVFEQTCLPAVVLTDDCEHNVSKPGNYEDSHVDDMGG